MKLPNKEELRPLGWSLVILLVIALAGIMFTDTGFSGMFTLAFAIFVYLILPGYLIMLNFKFTALERIIVGMVISAAVIPAFLYAINVFGLSLSTLNVIIVIIVVSALAVWYRKESNETNPNTSR